MSGSEAAPGTCPAKAYCALASAVAVSKTVKMQKRFISRLHDRVGGMTGLRIELPRRHLGWRGHRRWQRLAERQSHRGDLLLLGNDDLLSEPPDLRVATVAEHRNCHLDRALMVRHHHGYEIDVDVPGRFHRHVVHHFVHGGVILREERRFPLWAGSEH